MSVYVSIVAPMPGAFVVFEGGDGAGKSTQSRLLADALRARGLEVVVTREPGGTPIGEAIREVLLGAGSDGMAARTEALLFAAARAEHAASLIRPAVARGAVVISDRYLDSSVAYQGAARGLGEDRIAELSMWATEDLVPDLTVLLDVPPGVGLGRAGDANRMEAEPEAFHSEVAPGVPAAGGRGTGALPGAGGGPPQGRGGRGGAQPRSSNDWGGSTAAHLSTRISGTSQNLRAAGEVL